MEELLDTGSRLRVKIRFLLPTLPKIEKKAALWLLDNMEETGGMTLANFSETSGSSEASILRFCRRLGVNGFSELKALLHQESEIEDDADLPAFDVKPEDSMAEILEKVFFCNIQTLKDTMALVSSEYDKALDALLKARRVCFFSIGDAIVPCVLAQNKFMRLGIQCCVNTDADMQIITASNMNPGDAAIAISYSGKTKSVVDSMKLASERGATTICITKMEKSPLIRCCDIKLFTATYDHSEGKVIVARRIAEQAIMEALYLGLLYKGGAEYRENLKRTAEVLKTNKIP
ncbi:MAG: MurR/RpiR family transcriptional regulator [Synergistaceae bacterium]|jgi:DNA-binding MurR/RpiR family transcriptional regulator|nr:MurR/RpiR family transcriptional regulator [Synergistaceae bacterium]